jgi:hypothetical protein
MTETELKLVTLGMKLQRLLQDANSAASTAYYFGIGYDSKKDFWFIKDYGTEFKQVENVDALIEYLKKIPDMIRKNVDPRI